MAETSHPAETSQPPDEQDPVPRGGGAAERLREFREARGEEPPAEDEPDAPSTTPDPVDRGGDDARL